MVDRVEENLPRVFEQKTSVLSRDIRPRNINLSFHHQKSDESSPKIHPPNKKGFVSSQSQVTSTVAWFSGSRGDVSFFPKMVPRNQGLL